MTEPLAPAFVAFDDGLAALAELDATCCVPGRSPRMAQLRATIETAQSSLNHYAAGDGDPEAVSRPLEDAGGQVGRLQIGCCAPNRLPLYARILENLTTVQLTLNKADRLER